MGHVTVPIRGWLNLYNEMRQVERYLKRSGVKDGKCHADELSSGKMFMRR